MVLLVLNRFQDFKLPLEYIILLSLTAVLPDLIDKALTGTRFPFHSLLVSGLFLLFLNLVAWYYINSNPDIKSRYPNILSYLLFASIAFLTHPILDLEGQVPLFYPLDTRGYQLNFDIVIVQSIPPQISNFSLGFLIEKFDYDLTYDQEGALISTIDVLLAFLIGLPFVVKGLQKSYKVLRSLDND
ncbi:MAG: hypothetical protein JSW11_10990 [Candidatus Heimdallarchaeota archaeon]|nr:MAG: hypothetical protein JSW11_10990 [Candidatus Heimdallarchaeota archaeon]